MSMLYIAAATALTFAPPPAGAAPAEGPDAFVAVAAPQQGKGGGGGGKAQGGGGGGNGGGRQEARGGGRSGGRDQPRLQRQETRRESRGRGADRERGSSASQSRPRRERLAETRGSGSDRRRSETAVSRGSSGERRKAVARESGSGSGRGNASADARDRGSSTEAAVRDVASGSRGGSSAARGARRLAPGRMRERMNTLSPELRRFAGSSRASERMAAGALALATARGLGSDAVFVRPDNDRVRLLNRRNELLLDLDERRARDLGFWELRQLGDRQPRAGAPAFCQNGEGHPVWGREWCLDKGFGLGARPGFLWSRGRVDDVVYYRPYYDRPRLDRVGLVDVLGDIIFGRLALHALSLGFDQPLAGVWVADPGAPRILRVYSGDGQVAEFVDLDRDDRVEVLYVAQPVWY